MKHDFKGIKKLSSDLLRAFLILKLNSFGLGFILSNRLSSLIFDFFVKKLVNSFANEGLLFLNVVSSNTKVDSEEKALIQISDKALKRIYDEKMNRKILTKDEIKEIDDGIIKDFRNFGVIVD